IALGGVDAFDAVIHYCIKTQTALRSRNGMITRLLQIPTGAAASRMHQSEGEVFLLTVPIGKSIKGASPGSGHFSIDVIALQENLVIARVGRFVGVAEARCEVVGGEILAFERHQGNVLFSPLRVTRLRESLDRLDLIFISAA